MKAIFALLIMLICELNLYAKDKAKVSYEFTVKNSTGLLFGRSDINIPGLSETLASNGFSNFASGNESYDLRLEHFGAEISFAPHWVPINFSLEFLSSSSAHTDQTVETYSATINRSVMNFNMIFALSRGLLNLDLRGGIGSHALELTLNRTTTDDHPLFYEDQKSTSFYAHPVVYNYGVEAYLIAYFRFKIGARILKEKSSDLAVFDSYDPDLATFKSSMNALQSTMFVGIAF